MKRSLRLATVILGSLICSGCISRYYMGANIDSEGHGWERPVPRRLDKSLSLLSQECINGLMKPDISSLQRISTDELRKRLDVDDPKEKLEIIRMQYGLSGSYKQINSTGGGIYMDDVISQDPFKIYKFFVTEFLLEEKTNAHAFFLLKNTDGKLEVSGFDIHSASDQGYMPESLKGWVVPF